MIDLSWKTFLIVCPMVFLAGLVDSIGGGGGLISLPAYLLAGLPIHNATATNKMSSSMGAVVAAYRICRKRKIDWKLILPAIVFSLIGSLLGTRLNLITGDAVLKKVLLFVLPLVVLVVFTQKKGRKDSKENKGNEPNAQNEGSRRNRENDAGGENGKGGENRANRGNEANAENNENGGSAETEEAGKNGEAGKKLTVRVEYTVVWIGALIMGAYDGFYGPGTGTFLMIIFIGIARMGIIEAACYTKLLNLSSNIASLTTFLMSGKCIVILGIAAGFCSMAGSYVGSGLVLSNGQKIVRPIIIFVLILLFFKILIGW